jgi:hypothetical protein
MMQKFVAISQSMYFPWVGLLEQIRLADIFVHYDDVQFSKGSFSNRIQIKTRDKTKWLTIPLRDFRLGQHIDEVALDERRDWRSQHRDLLVQAYKKAAFRDDMLAIVDQVFSQPACSLSDVAKASVVALAHYFNLAPHRHFVDSKNLGIHGSSSQRVADIVKAVGGTVYITGHGAQHYLDHQLFERSGISVQYMHYRCTPYPQLYGDFTPYVTALDLVANCGKEGASVLQSEAIDWKRFIQDQQ